ncbi:MAG: hypothetical protein KDK55_03105 [Chlamydiia bacterium]|nr:hypothetical protein [Chlamydiia bacterium]
MTTCNPGDFGYVDSIQPIHDDHSDHDQQSNKKRNKVRYQGREWKKREGGELCLSFPKKNQKACKKESIFLYADKLYLDEVRGRFKGLATLEEQVAAICFLEAEAVYDGYLQKQMEQAVLRDQIGGFVFTRGEYKREQYLIEHLQKLAKTKLLIGNDFFHGLSFYFEGDLPLELLQEGMNERRYADLGKAVVAQNRRVGVDFQFDSPFTTKKPRIKTSEKHLQAFRHGIRDAKGIVGKMRRKSPSYSAALRKMASLCLNISLEASDVFKNLSVGEFSPDLKDKKVKSNTQIKKIENLLIAELVDHRSLEFYDITNLSGNKENKKRVLLEAFSNQFDVLLLPEETPSETIKLIVELIEEKSILYEQLEKRVMRVLLMKILLSH